MAGLANSLHLAHGLATLGQCRDHSKHKGRPPHPASSGAVHVQPLAPGALRRVNAALVLVVLRESDKYFRKAVEPNRNRRSGTATTEPNRTEPHRNRTSGEPWKPNRKKVPLALSLSLSRSPWRSIALAVSLSPSLSLVPPGLSLSRSLCLSLSLSLSLGKGRRAVQPCALRASAHPQSAGCLTVLLRDLIEGGSAGQRRGQAGRFRILRSKDITIQTTCPPALLSRAIGTAGQSVRGTS